MNAITTCAGIYEGIKTCIHNYTLNEPWKNIPLKTKYQYEALTFTQGETGCTSVLFLYKICVKRVKHRGVTKCNQR